MNLPLPPENQYFLLHYNTFHPLSHPSQCVYMIKVIGLSRQVILKPFRNEEMKRTLFVPRDIYCPFCLNFRIFEFFTAFSLSRVYKEKLYQLAITV